jgi:hypothetical protein
MTRDTGSRATALRLVVFGFIDDVTWNVPRKVLNSYKVDYCEYYYEVPQTFDERIPHRSHFYIDAQNGDYKVDWNTIAPLDERLLDSLARCETTVMRMLDRNDQWAPLTYDVRKSLYLKHVRYWSDCLARNQINLAIFSGIPHGNFDYVAYCICKLRGIPTLVYSCPSLWFDTVFLGHDIDDPAPDLALRFAELGRSVPPEARSQIPLPDWLERHYAKMTNTGIDQTPFYMNDPVWNHVFDRKPEKVWGQIQRLGMRLGRAARSPLQTAIRRLHLDVWTRGHEYQARRRTQDAVHREVVEFYNLHAAPLDLARRFIYVPLHLQPECTTCPMAGAFVEQQLMVELLAAAAPPDVLIYVKEHPMQDKYGIVSRSIGFYRELINIPSVRLAPRDTSTYTLMEHCVALSTATGAAGWEALFRRKPYLMFGHHVYQYAPGVIAVRDLASCKRAMDMVLHEGFSPEIPDLRLFLKAVEETAIRGFSLKQRREVTEIDDSENVTNLAAPLIEKIASLGFAEAKQ